MSDFLNHVVTVRDVIYTVVILFFLMGAAVAWLIWLTHPLLIERRRLKQGNHRNPVYGLRKS